jgi:hypothetical protein
MKILDEPALLEEFPPLPHQRQEDLPDPTLPGGTQCCYPFLLTSDLVEPRRERGKEYSTDLSVYEGQRR